MGEIFIRGKGVIPLSIAVVALGTLFFTNGFIQPQHDDVQTVASRGSSGG